MLAGSVSLASTVCYRYYRSEVYARRSVDYGGLLCPLSQGTRILRQNPDRLAQVWCVIGVLTHATKESTAACEVWESLTVRGQLIRDPERDAGQNPDSSPPSPQAAAGSSFGWFNLPHRARTLNNHHGTSPTPHHTLVHPTCTLLLVIDFFCFCGWERDRVCRRVECGINNIKAVPAKNCARGLIDTPTVQLVETKQAPQRPDQHIGSRSTLPSFMLG